MSTQYAEKSEDNELLFEAEGSEDVRQKFKTYKDLVTVADEIGHRELIYQFLEVHRHLAHYQNVKSAATGLNSIIMADEKLKN